MSLLEEINERYLQVHTEKENAFWNSKMGLSGTKSDDFEIKELAYLQFVGKSQAPKIREELARQDLQHSPEKKQALEAWLRFFQAHAIESPDAQALKDKIVNMEGKLSEARGTMKLGMRHPLTGNFQACSSVKLSLLLRTASTEAERRNAFEALASIENYVLENGFLEIVKERNRLARSLGYADYYDYRVQVNEGFSKDKLFDILDDLRKKTSDAAEQAVDELEKQHGVMAREAHNFGFLTSGDLIAQMDPYFQFSSALHRWGNSFAALGIAYRGATLQLDLLDRPGKYENGFMHGPIPAYRKQNQFSPATINFTSNAIPGQRGSGHRALETLFHEGGHAAHFSNIDMPAPCFSQEYAPTSVAFAETQSMFLDSLIEDADWQSRYARDTQGNHIPKELILKNIVRKQPYIAFQIRAMLSVCYAEKAIYEMPETELTSHNIMRSLRRIESELQFLKRGVRPILSVPHLLAGESSAYYHGYVLAQMAVAHTRHFFKNRDGHLCDNPKVGPDLAKFYWQPGNSQTFFELVHSLSGSELSADALVKDATRSVADVEAEALAAIEHEKEIPHFQGKVKLDAKISLVHGDEMVATLEQGGDFEVWEEKCRIWLDAQAPK